MSILSPEPGPLGLISTTPVDTISTLSSVNAINRTRDNTYTPKSSFSIPTYLSRANYDTTVPSDYNTFITIAVIALIFTIGICVIWNYWSRVHCRNKYAPFLTTLTPMVILNNVENIIIGQST